MATDRQVKILQVACGFRKGVSGGVPSIVHSYAMAMAGSDISFDCLSLGYQCYEPYRKDIENLGGRLFKLGITETGVQRLRSIVEKLSRFLRNNRYDIVQVNTGSVPQMFCAVTAAKIAGAEIVIAQSHSAKPVVGVRRVLYSFFSSGICTKADALWAVSKMAAESMFCPSVMRRGSWRLVPDAIHAERFAYNSQVRLKMRKALNLEGSFVIGHVGRFNEMKNHSFVLEVFKEVCKKRSDSILVLVGTGDLQKSIRQQAKDFGLEDKVLFLGQRTDVNELMQAMDVFLFPSLFEGLGIVVVEAQASGLPVVMGDNLPKESAVTNLVHRLPLSSGADAWASQILECAGTKREATTKQIAEAGYDIRSASASLQKYYRELVQKK